MRAIENAVADVTYRDMTPPLRDFPNPGVLNLTGKEGGRRGVHAGGWLALGFGADGVEVDEPGLEECAGHGLERFVRSAVQFDFVVEGAEYVKTGADVGLMVTSMGGGPLYVNIAYQMATGTIEQDFTEGVKRGVSTYSDAADTLIAAYDGWRTGGAWGAVEGAAWSIAMNKGPEAAMGRLNFSRSFDGGYRPIVPDGPAVREESGRTLPLSFATRCRFLHSRQHAEVPGLAAAIRDAEPLGLQAAVQKLAHGRCPRHRCRAR